MWRACALGTCSLGRSGIPCAAEATPPVIQLLQRTIGLPSSFRASFRSAYMKD